MYAPDQQVPEQSPITRPKPRIGSVTGHHARRRAAAIRADREQRARAWRRDYDA